MSGVIHWDPKADGELCLANMRWKLEKLGYTVFVYSYPAGTRFPPHSHNMDKMDGVLSGQFQLDMDGESVVLGPGDILEIPRGVEHSAEVVGKETVLSLDAYKPD